MGAIERNPANRDILQSTKFRLVFNRLPGLTFFCQTVNLPGISLTEVMRPTPFVDLYHPGEKAIYDTLNVTMLVSEDLADWLAIHDWIRGMTFPKEFEEYVKMDSMFRDSVMRRGSKLPIAYTDASLSIFTNKNNPQWRVMFKDCFPTNIGSIQFSSLDSAENIITADATFRFSYYDLQKV